MPGNAAGREAEVEDIIWTRLRHGTTYLLFQDRIT
jgi:hypothetical protein